MNDEEKKAIVELNHFSNMTAYWKQEEYTNSEIDNYIKIVLNLIEKQQKEIEELKIQNNKLAQCHFKYEEMTGVDLLLPDKLEYTSNNKIKAKIEVLEKLQKEFPNNDEIRIKIIAYKELLEKE